MTTPQEAIQKAMEALEPFAREANRADPELSNNTNLVIGDFKNYLKIGDLRRAREAHALLSQVEVSKSEREAALKEAAKKAAAYVIGMGLHSQRPYAGPHHHAEFIQQEIRSITSTPPKPAVAEDVVEQAVALLKTKLSYRAYEIREKIV